MTLTEVAPEEEYIKNSAKGQEEQYRVAREGWYYTIRELKEENGHPSARTYFPGTSRAAEVMLTKPGEEETKSIGTFGILHPEVLSNFDVLY